MGWLWAAGLAAYAFFRASEIGLLPSGLAAVALMLAPTTVSVAAYYSTRQYLFGLAWALLSLAAAQHWTRRGEKFWAAALACFALAALSKEIFVPLPVVAIALSAGRPGKRLSLPLAYLAVAAGYLGWRSLVLGQRVGGYSDGKYGRDRGTRSQREFNRVQGLDRRDQAVHERIADERLPIPRFVYAHIYRCLGQSGLGLLE